MKTTKNLCSALTKAGKPCPSVCISNDTKCFIHSERMAKEREAAWKKGGKHRSGKSVRRGQPGRVLSHNFRDCKVDSAETLRAFLSDTINQVRRGQMGTQIGACIGNLCNVMVRALQLDITDKQASDLSASVVKLQQLSAAQLMEIADKAERHADKAASEH